MKTTTLLDMAAMAGWAGFELSPGARNALRGLALCLPFGSGQGRATRDQVCDRMGYRDGPHVGRLLHELEAAGLIDWTRGGIDRGRHVAGFFRICKDRLAALVNAAREPHRRKVQEARAATRCRLARFRHARLMSRMPRVLVEFARLGTGENPNVQCGENPHLLPRRGESHRDSHPTTSLNTPPSAASKEDTMMTRLPDVESWRLPRACPHDDPKGPSHCALCRHAAMSAEQMAEWEADHGPTVRRTGPSGPGPKARAMIAEALAKAARR